MDYPLTNSEAEQLFMVEAAVRTQNFLQLSDVDALHLQIRGFLVQSGADLRITPLGHRVLRILRMG